MGKVVLSLSSIAFLAAALTFPCGSYTTQPVLGPSKQHLCVKRENTFSIYREMTGHFAASIEFYPLTKLILLSN